MKNLLIILCFIATAATCQKNQSDVQSQDENPCAPDVICTMEFKIVKLEIRNSAGEAIILDEFYTEIDGEKIEIPDDVYEFNEGTYPVATDAQMTKLDFEGKRVVFFGFIDEDLIVENEMIVGKDCCHIQLLEGKEKIVISN